MKKRGNEKMFQMIFKIILTAIALLPSVWVFAIAQKFSINDVVSFFPDCLLLSHFALFCSIIVLSRLAFETRRCLSSDGIPEGVIDDIRPANDGFLPSYLGYFFVALAIDDWLTFVYVFAFITIFVYSSRISYLNPVLFLFGYKFFLIRCRNVERLILTKKNLHSPASLCFRKLKRVNNYTFIDMEGQHDSAKPSSN